MRIVLAGQFAVRQPAQRYTRSPLSGARVTLDLPSGAVAGTTMDYVAALTNPTGTDMLLSPCPGYQQLIDNDRVRAWRLTLAPGKSVAAITQRAPGMRIVVDGGEISESIPGAVDRGWGLRTGEFFWQDPGVTRTVKNIGTNPINIVEFELK